MKGRELYWIWAVFLALVFVGCQKEPDPWSPKTYPLQLRDYKKDTGALGPEWKKYEIKGHEDNSFFFAREGAESIISIYFTCGKYGDISLDKVAGHLVIPMGRDYETVRKGFVQGGDKVYHIVAEGDYQYHKEELYLEEGLIPDLKAGMVLDAYVSREKDCIVDVVYAAPPEEYAEGLEDFHRYLESVGLPAEKIDGE